MATSAVDVRSRRGFDFSKWAVFPALCATILFFVVPLGVMLLWSFYQRIGGKIDRDLSTANYVKFFGKPYLFEGLINSIEVALITSVVSIILAYPLAYIIAYKIPARWQRFALILAVLPFWTSYVIRSYSWLLILSERGIINSVLLGLGVIDEPVTLGYNRGATVLGFVHFFTMLLTLTIYANLVQIKDSYRMAAADLGASPVQVFLRVTLPLSLPGVAVGAFLTFVIAIGDYITPQILGGAKELLLPQAIMLQVTRAADFPMASAMSMTLMVVVTIAYLVFAKYLKMERV
ncbi:MAG: ABC transporter permease [Hyphomicrobiales bacterium]|nr:ABC transporter permease [Hyphomicrobiales bacterium]